VQPMIMGLSNFARLVAENRELAFFAHPTLAGTRIAPPLLFGKLFRMLGADALASVLASCAGLDAKAVAARIESVALEIQQGNPRDDIAILALRIR